MMPQDRPDLVGRVEDRNPLEELIGLQIEEDEETRQERAIVNLNSRLNSLEEEFEESDNVSEEGVERLISEHIYAPLSAYLMIGSGILGLILLVNGAVASIPVIGLSIFSGMVFKSLKNRHSIDWMDVI
jgi:hypothetical protein